jgi:hypothetical protein
MPVSGRRRRVSSYLTLALRRGRYAAQRGRIFFPISLRRERSAGAAAATLSAGHRPPDSPCPFVPHLSARTVAVHPFICPGR